MCVCECVCECVFVIYASSLWTFEFFIQFYLASCCCQKLKLGLKRQVKRGSIAGQQMATQLRPKRLTLCWPFVGNCTFWKTNCFVFFFLQFASQRRISKMTLKYYKNLKTIINRQESFFPVPLPLSLSLSLSLSFSLCIHKYLI